MKIAWKVIDIKDFEYKHQKKGYHSTLLFILIVFSVRINYGGRFINSE